MAEERTLDQRLIETAKHEGGKRLIYWLLGGGIGVVAPILLIIIVVIAGLSLLAGIGQWAAGFFGPSPPAIATPMSRPTEWISIASQDGATFGVPNIVAEAVIEQASGGEVFGDRHYCSNGQSAGEACGTAYHGSHTIGIGYGLLGIDSKSGLIPKGQPPHSVSWNVSAGLKALGPYLTGDWKSGLAAFHAAVQVPPGWTSTGYADQIRSLVESYDSGPQLGAWALAPWSSKTGQFTDPGHTPEWVMVVGSAPTGLRGSHAWKPPTVEMVKNPKTGKLVTKVIPHDLSYTDLSGPIQVWGTEKSGRNVPFTSSAVSGSQVPVWSGGVVWGGKVPLTGPDALKSITARWSNGQIETIAWPEVGNSSGVTIWHLLSNPQALKRWWPDIQVAAHQAGAGIPRKPFEDAIGATMLHESGGNPTLWANGVVGGAYGLMQIEPATARGLPGYYPGARHNPQENLILGAELLSELYGETHSWHETFALYYDGHLAPTWHPGVPWAPIAGAENFVPPGNVETVAAYADGQVAEMKVVASEAPKHS